MAFRTRLGLAALLVITSLAAIPTADAGDVTAEFLEGTLTLTGSATADSVLVIDQGRFTLVLALPGSKIVGGRLRGRFQTYQDLTAISVTAGDGDDSFQILVDVDTLSFDGGLGNDSLIADVGAAADVKFLGGDNDDTVVLNADGAISVSLDGGAGNDLITVTDSVIGSLTILGGTEDDRILVNGVDSPEMLGSFVSVDAGTGNDTLAFQSCNLVSSDPMLPFVLEGGDGDMDQAGQAESTFTPAPTVQNFETLVGFDPPPPPPSTSPIKRRKS